MTLSKLLRLIPALVLLQGVACSQVPTGFDLPAASRAETMTVEEHEGGLSPDEIRQLLAEHNRVRAAVGVGPLGWSPDLAAYAWRWAVHLADDGCSLAHRPTTGPWRSQYGENLFAATVGYYGVVDAIQAWESERRFYHDEALTLSNWYSAGHYTQLVWRNTRLVGCGRSECRGQVVIVCNYDPPGNVLGERPY